MFSFTYHCMPTYVPHVWERHDSFAEKLLLNVNSVTGSIPGTEHVK